MVIVECVQGTPEWAALRAGIPTASGFDKLVTSTGKPSTQIEKYALALAAERVMGKPAESFQSEWMKRGTELEDEARSFVSIVRGVEIQQPGLVYRDENRDRACSPDGMYGEGGVELKCPSPAVHLQYLLEQRLPPDYVAQVQGCMYVTGAPWWDFVSYHPDMPPLLLRVPRDGAYIATLHTAVEQCLDTVNRHMAKLMELGVIG